MPRRNPISTRVFALPAFVWLAGVVAVAIRFATSAHEITIPMWMAGGLQLFGVIFLLAGPLTTRIIMSESEPTDSAGSPEPWHASPTRGTRGGVGANPRGVDRKVVEFAPWHARVGRTGCDYPFGRDS